MRSSFNSFVFLLANLELMPKENSFHDFEKTKVFILTHAGHNVLTYGDQLIDEEEPEQMDALHFLEGANLTFELADIFNRMFNIAKR